MTLPADHQWPRSLHAANAVEELAMMLDGWRSQFSGSPVREWSKVPAPQKQMYRDLATRLLMQLGPIPQWLTDDPKLERVDRHLARAFEVVK